MKLVQRYRQKKTKGSGGDLPDGIGPGKITNGEGELKKTQRRRTLRGNRDSVSECSDSGIEESSDDEKPTPLASEVKEEKKTKKLGEDDFTFEDATFDSDSQSVFQRGVNDPFPTQSGIGRSVFGGSGGSVNFSFEIDGEAGADAKYKEFFRNATAMTPKMKWILKEFTNRLEELPWSSQEAMQTSMQKIINLLIMTCWARVQSVIKALDDAVETARQADEIATKHKAAQINYLREVTRLRDQLNSKRKLDGACDNNGNNNNNECGNKDCDDQPETGNHIESWEPMNDLDETTRTLVLACVEEKLKGYKGGGYEDYIAQLQADHKEELEKVRLESRQLKMKLQEMEVQVLFGQADCTINMDDFGKYCTSQGVRKALEDVDSMENLRMGDESPEPYESKYESTNSQECMYQSCESELDISKAGMKPEEPQVNLPGICASPDVSCTSMSMYRPKSVSSLRSATASPEGVRYTKKRPKERNLFAAASKALAGKEFEMDPESSMKSTDFRCPSSASIQKGGALSSGKAGIGWRKAKSRDDFISNNTCSSEGSTDRKVIIGVAMDKEFSYRSIPSTTSMSSTMVALAPITHSASLHNPLDSMNRIDEELPKRVRLDLATLEENGRATDSTDTSWTEAKTDPTPNPQHRREKTLFSSVKEHLGFRRKKPKPDLPSVEKAPTTANKASSRILTKPSRDLAIAPSLVA